MQEILRQFALDTLPPVRVAVRDRFRPSVGCESREAGAESPFEFGLKAVIIRVHTVRLNLYGGRWNDAAEYRHGYIRQFGRERHRLEETAGIDSPRTQNAVVFGVAIIQFVRRGAYIGDLRGQAFSGLKLEGQIPFM